MRFAIAALLAAIAAPAVAAPEGWSKLLSPVELAGILERAPEVRVLHVGFGYAQGHVPGAVEAPLSTLRGEAENPGAIPPLEGVIETVRGWGLTAETPVVVVHDGWNAADFGNAARVYWSLKSLGIEDLAILNGGFRGWAAAGLPVSTVPVPVPATGWTPAPDESRRATTGELRALLEGGAPPVLVDARLPSQFEGRDRHPAATRPGTMPGAMNLPFPEFFDGPAMLPPEAVRARVAAAGLPEGEPVVAFCNTGMLASTAWFALSEIAEVPDVRLYSSSIVEWSQAGAPMENVPGRLTHYWRMFAGWLSGLLA